MTKTISSPLYGVWEVTTEGDCEGRSTMSLGVFEGWIDEVALSLADKAMYNLFISRLESTKMTAFVPTGKSVIVYLPPDLTGPDSAEAFNSLSTEANRFSNFADPAYRSRGCINLVCGTLSEEEIAIHRNRKSGLAKLTDDEKKALGF